MQQSKELAVEWRPIAEVFPYEGNPRRISEQAVDKVAASIEAFGWRQPIVVDPAGVIIVGHTRFRAAQQLGLDRVPVHIADLSAEQARAYRLADNRLAEETGWDEAKLHLELGALSAADFDLSLAGFDPVDLSSGDAFAPIDAGEVKPLDRIDVEKCPACGRPL
ncbi:ParB N-terminal domain-containing protein [Consotaella aegiceratis]|uniref:ParB N-terminal domain-containing protein n=1 Tax=Consotaella aegiceratis TaxID=3097961 RepID=UPI002F42C4EB